MPPIAEFGPLGLHIAQAGRFFLVDSSAKSEQIQDQPPPPGWQQSASLEFSAQTCAAHSALLHPGLLWLISQLPQGGKLNSVGLELMVGLNVGLGVEEGLELKEGPELGL